MLQRIEQGSLTIVLPDGSRHTIKGDQPGPDATVEIKSFKAVRRFFTGGELGFSEAYLDELWDSPDLSKVVELTALNQDAWKSVWLGNWLVRRIKRLVHRLNDNTKRGSKKNIAYHYDLGNSFYKEWLDPTMTYSSAKFERDEQPLDEAQMAKYRSIAEMLDLKPEHRVLEIGCGWGGFAEFAAKEYGCHITGLTLSERQLEFARDRVDRAGVGTQVDLRLQDYRDVGGTFDRIASIEMFEAVGEKYWPTYFNTVRERLNEGGVAALQIITIDHFRYLRYRKRVDFIQRYIFPGGMLPSVQALGDQLDGAKLKLTDSSFFGMSYARTLELWREQFLKAWHQIEPQGFDDRFKRMWEFYLSYCEGGFRAGSINVGQFRIERS